MMNSIFNSAFEISLRVLLILENSNESLYSSDMLAAIDFMAVYGQDFGVSDNNMHGNNLFKYSEFATRRELTKEATKNLVLKGLVSVDCNQNGFTYTITTIGTQYCASLKSDYANSYRAMVTKVNRYIKDLSEKNVMKLINKHSIKSLRRGGS